jgi:hypothetical protein
MPLTSHRSDREFLWLTFGLWLAVYVLHLAPGLASPDGVPSWKAGLLGLCVGLALLLCPLVYLALKRTEGRPYRTRAGATAAVVIAAAAAVSALNAGLYELAYPRFAPDKTPAGFLRWFLSGLLLYGSLYGLYATAIALLLSRGKMEEHERQLAQARAAAHQAQLAALRFQLNPHFLFNTLNAISSLIVTARNREAELMMQRLSEFLRASLASDPDGFASLGDELATVETYLEIERVRFGDRLQVEISCTADLLDALVPSFILQPLVENAVKYAVAPARRPVIVRVEASQAGEDLVLRVQDDGEGPDRLQVCAGTGVGLDNVRRRLEVLYAGRGVLQAAPRPRGFLALVRLPLTHALASRGSAAA